ncbi:MAG TPA: hypothetical protein VFN65_16275 [Solirubrobacteraceae bacterium]|nr:hypothetical protein [Solirubrobacteraceae bacterium]
MPSPTSCAGLLAGLLATVILAGCGTSGYGTVNAHQLVLIPRARSASAAGRRAEAALVCAARAEARRLHRALRVARPRSGSASSQIEVVNAVTALKPGGVLIVPVAGNAMLAPILSLRGAGIAVARLPPPRAPAAAAVVGAHAVAEVVGRIERRHTGSGGGPEANVAAPCAFVS